MDLGSGTRPIAGVRPEAGQVRVGLPTQESHGVFEIGVEQIVVIDEGGDRRIAVHRSAEIVEREPIARQFAQEPQGRGAAEQPPGGRDREPHPRRKPGQVLRPSAQKLEHL